MITFMNNNEELRRIKNQYELTSTQIAATCAVSSTTVRKWLVPQMKSNEIHMPDGALKLLRLAVGELSIDEIRIIKES